MQFTSSLTCPFSVFLCPVGFWQKQILFHQVFSVADQSKSVESLCLRDKWLITI